MDHSPRPTEREGVTMEGRADIFGTMEGICKGLAYWERLATHSCGTDDYRLGGRHPPAAPLCILPVSIVSLNASCFTC